MRRTESIICCMRLPFQLLCFEEKNVTILVMKQVVKTMEKLTNRKKQAMASRQRLLDATITLLGQKGFDDITIQDISSAAGMSPGNFYHYFKSKEAIVLALYGLSDDYFEDTVMPRLLASNESAIERIMEFAQEQTGFAVKYGVEPMGRLYRAQIAYNSAGFYSEQRGLVGGMVRLIQDGQQSGELKQEFPAEQIANEVLLLIRGVILDWIWKGTDDPQKTAAHMVWQYMQSYSCS